MNLTSTNSEDTPPPKSGGDLKVAPMSRNLPNIWARYENYDESNTVVVSNYFNEIEDFQRNDIVIPVFEPKFGKTDFLND